MAKTTKSEIQKSACAATDVGRDEQIYNALFSSHLFREFSQLISIGSYQRLPEFRALTYSLTDQQLAKLRSALKTELSDEAAEALQTVVPKLIEHELILVRAPSVVQVLEEIVQFEERAFECLKILRNFQMTFNDAEQKIAQPTFGPDDVAHINLGPADAYTVAVNIIRRNLMQPIPAFLELGPFLKTCQALRKTFQPHRGPKADTILVLYLATMGMCSHMCGIEPTLPKKSSFERQTTNMPTPFFIFAREAVGLLGEAASALLDQETITDEERESVMIKLKGYLHLTDAALADRLSAAVRLKTPGLKELFAI